MKIRLFIKPYCGWCHKAMRWLDDHDIAYEKIDVIADDAAFAEMVRLSGRNSRRCWTWTEKFWRISARKNCQNSLNR
jgi:arsenate reductase